MTIEHRHTPPRVELRDAGDGNWSLQGQPSDSAPYKVTDSRGTFAETIPTAAWRAHLATSPTIELRVEHRSDGPVLAATGRSNTMTIGAGDNLTLAASLDKADPDAQAAVSKIRRQTLDRLSVGFRAVEDRWNSSRSERTVLRAELCEVSLVSSPANPRATVSVRGGGTADLECRFVPIEYRLAANGVGRQCANCGAWVGNDGDTCPDCGACALCGAGGDEQNAARKERKRRRSSPLPHPFDSELRRRAGLPAPPSEARLSRGAAEIRLRAAKLK